MSELCVNCERPANNAIAQFQPSHSFPQRNNRDHPGQDLSTQRDKKDHPGQNLNTFSWSPLFPPFVNDDSRWKINYFHYSFLHNAASLKTGVQGAKNEVPSFVPCWKLRTTQLRSFNPATPAPNEMRGVMELNSNSYQSQFTHISLYNSLTFHSGKNQGFCA